MDIYAIICHDSDHIDQPIDVKQIIVVSSCKLINQPPNINGWYPILLPAKIIITIYEGPHGALSPPNVWFVGQQQI